MDTQLQITGSILQPNLSGNIKLSHGEAYLPHEKGGGAAAISQEASDSSSMPSGGYNQVVASKYVSRFLNLKPATINASFEQPSGLYPLAFLFLRKIIDAKINVLIVVQVNRLK